MDERTLLNLSELILFIYLFIPLDFSIIHSCTLFSVKLFQIDVSKHNLSFAYCIGAPSKRF